MLKYLVIIIGVLGLIGVRMMEDTLFYDPFLLYFKSGNKEAPIPQFDWLPLIGSHFFRLALNLFFSALVLQGIFNDKKATLQGLVLMFIVFIISLFLYSISIGNTFSLGYLFTFYLRRFVIQPVILLLIIPIIFYSKKNKKEKQRLL